MVVAPPEDSGHGGRYRRTGTVEARQLVESRDWTTSSGVRLQGQPGDWLVESADGGIRTVANAAFVATHRLVEGTTWERIGTVTAARVTQACTVSTLEGPVPAHVGDWILTDAQGNSWPIRDEVFRVTYEPVPDE